MTDHAPLMLSVSGARGIVGESMTPEVAARFASVFGSRLVSTSGGIPTACLGRDSRVSGELLAQAAANGLMAAGCNVIDLGVVATPTIGVMVTATASGGGIMITASHNPNPWNGIKCIGPGGSAPPAAVAEEVIAGFRDHEGDLPPIDPERTLSMESRGDDTHIARVLGQIDPAPICAKNYGVVLDSVNGAGCRSGLKLLELLGCDVLHLNGDPTGDFAHTPEPRESNLGSLMEVAAESDVVIGFAQDPDADRLAIVDGHGRYIGEEYTLALATEYMLRQREGGVVVTNLSTSRMVDDIAARYGGRVVRTPVGEANVVEAMRREDALIGGEGNGGVIIPGVCHIRDSLGAMALVLASMAETGRSLEELVDDIPSYAMIKRSCALPGSGGPGAVAPVLEAVRSHFASASIDASDGVRIDFDDAWVHVRASNTEPIARIISEAPQAKVAEELIATVADLAGWTMA
ncbi:MAG: phosphoglucosamine mutase [Phycisphaerales bacterium]|nr:phosphoglucosamine mutase [Phycisphaerales bacterium]